MSASLEDYLEVLTAEINVDVSKLQFFARHGVPAEIRGETWLYLLGVLADNKSKEMSSVREKYLVYKALDKSDKSPNGEMSRRIKGEMGRGHKRLLFCLKSVFSSVSVGETSSSRGRSVPAGFYCTYTAPLKEPVGVHNDPHGQIASLLEGREGLDKRLSSEATTNQAAQSLLVSERSPKSDSTSPIPIYAASTSPSLSEHARNQSTWQASPIGIHMGNQIHHDISHDALQLPSASLSHSPPYSESGTIMSTSSSTTYSTSVSNNSNRYFTSSWATVSDLSLLTKTVEHVILAYSNGHQRDANDHTGQDFQQSALTHLCLPFVVTMQTEPEIYFALEKWLEYLAADTSHQGRATFATTRFTSAFRALLPDLYAYFEEEEFDLVELAESWLAHYFAKEMRMDNLLRLWDTYLATASAHARLTQQQQKEQHNNRTGTQRNSFGLDTVDQDGQCNDARRDITTDTIMPVNELHLYVCLAVLTRCKDDLEELEQSEIRSMLLRLPDMDIDRLLNEAFNIRLILQKLD